MHQQLAINPCVCGISNEICPVHPPLGLAPSNLHTPMRAVMREDFDESMELVDSREIEALRRNWKQTHSTPPKDTAKSAEKGGQP